LGTPSYQKTKIKTKYGPAHMRGVLKPGRVRITYLLRPEGRVARKGEWKANKQKTKTRRLLITKKKERILTAKLGKRVPGPKISASNHKRDLRRVLIRRI